MTVAHLSAVVKLAFFFWCVARKASAREARSVRETAAIFASEADSKCAALKDRLIAAELGAASAREALIVATAAAERALQEATQSKAMEQEVGQGRFSATETVTLPPIPPPPPPPPP
jgi:wobble nucleotide-excising tRNase